MSIAKGWLWPQAVIVLACVAIGVAPSWAAPVLSRVEPDRALAPARGLLVKLHGSGFELGDQVELMRADVPALRGSTARIRSGSMAGDYRHEVVLPDEWTREPGELQMRVVSARREASGWAILRLTALMLTPGSPIGVLPARVAATPDPVTIPLTLELPVTIRGGPFEAGMTYEVMVNLAITGRHDCTKGPRRHLEIMSPTTASIRVNICCFRGQAEFRLFNSSDRLVTDWIRIPGR